MAKIGKKRKAQSPSLPRPKLPNAKDPKKIANPKPGSLGER